MDRIIDFKIILEEENLIDQMPENQIGQISGNQIDQIPETVELSNAGNVKVMVIIKLNAQSIGENKRKVLGLLYLMK